MTFLASSDSFFGMYRLVEPVGLLRPLTEDDVELLAERVARNRRVGEPEPRDRALAEGERLPVVDRGLRAARGRD